MIRISYSILLLVFILTTTLSAQEIYRLEGGVLAGPSFPVGDQQNVLTAYTIRGLLRYGFGRTLFLEIGGARTFYQFESSIPGFPGGTREFYPFDVRFALAPWLTSPVSPYLFFGGGVTLYSADTNGPLFGGAESGTYAHLPIGIGLRIGIAPKFAVDIEAYNNLDINHARHPTIDRRDDGSWETTAGVVYLIRQQDEPDSDGDGLKDRDERKVYRTDPKRADSDGDGLTDGEEVVEYHTNPLNSDSDGDGFSDGDEVHLHHTRPDRADTDEDGLNDFQEVTRYHTDPLVADSDGDGLADGAEVKEYYSDPTRKDTDGDGLEDGAEVRIHKSSPIQVDTDKDGLTDGVEVSLHYTDPLDPDTDKDGLKDGEEITVYHTSPTVSDSDGGGVGDGEEIRRGTNPNYRGDDRR